MANIHSILEKNLDKIVRIVLERLGEFEKSLTPATLNLQLGGKFFGEIFVSRPLAKIFPP